MGGADSPGPASGGALRCPECGVDLEVVPRRGWMTFRCAQCRGAAATMPALRQLVTAATANRLWRSLPEGRPGRPCPGCARPLSVVSDASSGKDVDIDLCRGCQLVWFDADELQAFAPSGGAARGKVARRGDLSARSREALALARLEASAKTGEAESHAKTSATMVHLLAELLGSLVF